MSTPQERVANGSRRKRDLAAVAEAPTPPPDAVLTEHSKVAWDEIRCRLELGVTESVWSIWLDPLTLAGEHNGFLHLTVRRENVYWIGKRWGKWIGNLSRELGYQGATIGAS